MKQKNKKEPAKKPVKGTVQIGKIKRPPDAEIPPQPKPKLEKM